jgi:prepilin-type N-terminal cleavage/methylation domain-containing protein
MDKKGYSLVEVTVAAVIFAVAVAGVFASVASMHQQGTKSGNKLRAAQLSKKVLESLRQQVSANNPAALNSNQGSSTTPLTDADFPGYGYWYTVTTDAATQVKRVDITVRTPP